jgi:Fe2+ or Zn2+ uptake regulation protein
MLYKKKMSQSEVLKILERAKEPMNVKDIHAQIKNSSQNTISRNLLMLRRYNEIKHKKVKITTTDKKNRKKYILMHYYWV